MLVYLASCTIKGTFETQKQNRNSSLATRQMLVHGAGVFVHEAAHKLTAYTSCMSLCATCSTQHHFASLLTHA